MTVYELTLLVLILIASSLLTVYGVFFWSTAEPQIDASLDQARDIELLLSNSLNLMDPKQLAESQVEQDGPFQICVFAPDPLENHNENVYHSTLEWVRRHIDEIDDDWKPTRPGELSNSPRLQFWCRISDKTPGALRIIKRLHSDLSGDDRIFKMFECVKAPDHLFLFDLTVHFFRDRSRKAFQNMRENGVTAVLLQMSAWDRDHTIEKLGEWLRHAEETELLLDETGTSLFRPPKTEIPTAHYIRCFTVQNGGSTPSRKVVAEQKN
jgi:hypothetical protein